jgi:RAVE protein 1 C terminal
VPEDQELKSKIEEAGVKTNFNVADYIAQMKAAPAILSKANIANLIQWNSLQTCLALHSEMQDVLYNEIAERFDFEANLNYDLLKKMCIPIWLKDTNKLKTLVGIIAKNEYKAAGDDFAKSSKAEKTALWYLLIDRKDQLLRLYKQEVTFKKVYELLLNDFTV